MCYFFKIEKIFADDIPLCTEPECSQIPEKEGDCYKGLVKPGMYVIILNLKY